jgi:hypothetical protein
VVAGLKEELHASAMREENEFQKEEEERYGKAT